MQRYAKIIILGFVLLAPTLARAKVDPLRIITERMSRSEIVLVIDTSGSMAWYPSPAYAVGTDCGGDRTSTVDLCGDGMCTGAEGSSINTCFSDCNVGNPYVAVPGMAPTCMPGTALNSRMFMVKRVLRNLLPDLRKTASFGLVTFRQTGYFRYYRAFTGTKKTVSIFLSKFEMEMLGAWDATAKKPKATFTRHGTAYTLLSGAVGGWISQDKDSLYARSDNLAQEDRFKFSVAGLTYSNNNLTWKYRGSFYVYDQSPASSGDRVTRTEYYGPQYTDGFGQIWVYHRYYYYYWDSQGINGYSSGKVVVPLEFNAGDQTKLDKSLFNIVFRMNYAWNGGLWARGGTPTAAAINSASNHYYDRHNGLGIYAGLGPDPEAACRGRFALVLTDGQHGGSHPRYAAANLYNRFMPANPIKTMVVGLPGLPSSAMAGLDDTADGGNDGDYTDNDKTAMYANNESQLLKVIKEALFEMVKGDYTTGGASAATSGGSTTTGDIAIIPSTDYPGWKGHLRAMDLTLAPAKELWDAGKELNSMEYKNRRIFTGFPDSNSGIPVPLLDTNGVVNLDGSGPGAGGVGVRDVWTAVETPPKDATIVNTVEWLLGKNRSWRLPPILRSGPAVIGGPPKYVNVNNHETFRKIHITREKLIYVTSNEGILHAFRFKNGTEAFGYVPPNLWPKIRALYHNGGQETDPTKFKWILASSPRVDDIPHIAVPKITWSTELALAMGPGEKAFVALDITNPSKCNAISCTVNDPPFKILAHSRDVTGLSTVMGETWSVPVLFYAYPTSAAQPSGRMAMGSGYGTATQGHYYNYFSALYKTFSSQIHSSTGAEVDFAMLTDTSAAIDFDKARDIIAVYQGDLKGRILRYDKGLPTKGTNVLNAGVKDPFYYSPALYHKGASKVLLAAVSGTHDEESPPAAFESTIYLRLDDAGTTDSVNDYIDCDVTDVCSTSATCPDSVPSSCKAPGQTAQPVCPPLILKNTPIAGVTQFEAFFLFYEPPSTPCDDGTSWLVRISSAGATQKVISIDEYTKTRATGMTVVGGGLDVVITAAGFGGKPATVKSVTNNITSGALVGTAVYVEGWKEVKP